MAEAVERNMHGIGLSMGDQGRSWQRFSSHDKPIPASHVYCLQEALAWCPDWYWIVEEDIVPPDLTLAHLIEAVRFAGPAVITARYYDHGGCTDYHLNANGILQYAGIGCVLFSHQTMQALQQTPRELFQNNLDWKFPDDEFGKPSPKSHGFRDGLYGGLDVHFWAQVHLRKIPALLSEQWVEHWEVVKLGAHNQNDGCHEMRPIKP